MRDESGTNVSGCGCDLRMLRISFSTPQLVSFLSMGSYSLALRLILRRLKALKESLFRLANVWIDLRCFLLWDSVSSLFALRFFDIIISIVGVDIAALLHASMLNQAPLSSVELNASSRTHAAQITPYYSQWHFFTYYNEVTRRV